MSGIPDALLLDEMFSPAIATDLAARGIDCRAVVTDPMLRALSDLEIFQAVLAEGRVLVTNNIPDFERLRRAHEAAGNEVPRLIYTSDLTFPRIKAYVSRLGAALAPAAVGRETARCGGVLWLRPPALCRSHGADKIRVCRPLKGELSLFTRWGGRRWREFCGCGLWRAGVCCRVLAGHPDRAAGPVFSGHGGCGLPVTPSLFGIRARS